MGKSAIKFKFVCLCASTVMFLHDPKVKSRLLSRLHPQKLTSILVSNGLCMKLYSLHPPLSLPLSSHLKNCLFIYSAPPTKHCKHFNQSTSPISSYLLIFPPTILCVSFQRPSLSPGPNIIFGIQYMGKQILPMGHIWLATCFYKQNFIGTMPILVKYTLSMVTFLLQ